MIATYILASLICWESPAGTRLIEIPQCPAGEAFRCAPEPERCLTGEASRCVPQPTTEHGKCQPSPINADLLGVARDCIKLLREYEQDGKAK